MNESEFARHIDLAKRTLLANPDPVTKQSWAQDLGLLRDLRGRYIAFYDDIDASGTLTRRVLADADSLLEIHRLKNEALAQEGNLGVDHSRVIVDFVE